MEEYYMNNTNTDKDSENKINIDEKKILGRKKAQNKLTVKRIMFYMLGALEVLFALRLVFKILGANTGSVFISTIYSVTDIFLAPFKGIFRTAVTQGIETESVLEPELIIAMIVYALLIWGIDKFIDIMNSRKNF